MEIATNDGRPRPDRNSGRDAALIVDRSLYSLPNLITAARLLATLPIVWLTKAGAYDAAFVVFVAAAASDALDGFIAKRFGSRTTLGTWLDPVADKVLLVSVYLVLTYEGLLPTWLVAVIIARDLCVTVGAVVLQRRGQLFQLQPLTVGKLNTLAQIVLAAVVLADAGTVASLGRLVIALIYAVALLTLVSGAAYIAQGVRMALAPGKAT